MKKHVDLEAKKTKQQQQQQKQQQQQQRNQIKWKQNKKNRY